LVTFISFVILIGVLIFVHELGHFLAARMGGVGVLKFSLGFGPKIFGKKIGETEYVLSWVPLGGYVKLLGESGTEELSLEDQKRSFYKQPTWKRMLIVFAGPFFNFLLAIAIFSVVYMYGIPNVAPVVGPMAEDAAAKEAGIVSGDKIISMNGKKIQFWDEMDPIIKESNGQEMTIDVLRNGQEKTMKVKPKLTKIKNIFGGDESVYSIGVAPASNVLAVIGEVQNDSAAKAAGLSKGDHILSIDGKKITYWDEIRPLINASKGRELKMVVLRGDEERIVNVTPKLSKVKNMIGEEQDAYLIGITAAGYIHAVVGDLTEDSAAKKAGVETGDTILSINNEKIRYWDDIHQAVSISKAGDLKIVVRRGAEEKTLIVKVSASPGEKRSKKTGSVSVLGISPASHDVIERKNPVKAVVSSLDKTWELSKLTVVAVVKMVEGAISPRTLGGPIFIAQVAGKQVKEGLIPFILFMAILSVNLGVINLFPIPVLDGGHIFFYLIEMVTRREIPIKVREISQQIGFVFLLMLMLFVIMIDIERLNLKPVNDVLKFFK
jgi:regulator of sigma E protease